MYDFEVNNNVITVNDRYFGKDMLNEYFSTHKLNNDYPLNEIAKLIEAVAFTLDNDADNEDEELINRMLKE